MARARITIGRDELLRELETNGFQFADERTFLDYQYFLVFTARWIHRRKKVLGVCLKSANWTGK